MPQCYVAQLSNIQRNCLPWTFKVQLSKYTLDLLLSFSAISMRFVLADFQSARIQYPTYSCIAVIAKIISSYCTRWAEREVLQPLLFVSYCMVALPCKNPPLSMTDVVVQFFLAVNEEIVSRNLHLLGFRLSGFFQCEVVAFGCKDLATCFHNLISGKRFIKSIKHKSNKEMLWKVVFQLLLILFLFLPLIRSVNSQWPLPWLLQANQTEI